MTSKILCMTLSLCIVLFTLYGQMSVDTAAVTASTPLVSGFPPDCGDWLQEFTPIQPSSVFQFIPKLLEGVEEVADLCRLVRFFHTQLEKSFIEKWSQLYAGRHCDVETRKWTNTNCWKKQSKL